MASRWPFGDQLQAFSMPIPSFDDARRRRPAHDIDWVADVLCIVVQHCARWAMNDICALLQVNSVVGRELQRTRAYGCMAFANQGSLAYLERQVSAFTYWLPQHAGLISRLVLNVLDDFLPAEMQQLQHMYASALRLYRRQVAAAAAVQHRGAAQQHTVPLRPESVVLYMPPARVLLQELAATGIEELSLERSFALPRGGGHCWLPAHTDDVAALSVLQSLRSLCCESFELRGRRQVAAFWGALWQLSALTDLALGSATPLDPAAALRLPLSLRQLGTRFTAGRSSSSSGGNGEAVVDLRHLLQLRQLKWTSDGRLPADVQLRAVLPRQLTRLEMLGAVHRVSAAPGQRRVDLGFDLAEDLSNTQDLELLQCFSSLQGPWALTLSLDLAPQANTALSSLQELLLMPQQPIEARLLGWIAARLPRLQSLNAAVAGADSSSCLRALSRHPELRCLELQGRLGFDVGVAQLTQLAALTQLTYLWLRPLSCSAAAERRFLAGMPRLRKIGTEQPRQPWH